jgi:pro-apoptotic serine protease NMA111
LLVRTDFRLKVVTFDSVPWVVTMKKNEHYFPTVEWIKDSADPCGWRRITYEGGRALNDEDPQEAPVIPIIDNSVEVEADGDAEVA